ncbi:MAG: cache domain-containing protein [Candidatus Eremiobacteraeota bacterium]|nr:cache domain-containing protein [Candidatus Eremiobacteraeota bacterium]
MNMSLRVRLLGTIIGAMLLFFIISVIAARFTLAKDLNELGQNEVTNGSQAFGGYWDSHKDQIRLLISQDAVSDALRKNLVAHNSKALQDQLSNIARASGLSFLTITDTKGNVIARANGPNRGSLATDKYVQRALTGETVSTAAILPADTLKGEGLDANASSDIKSADGKVVHHLDRGLTVIAAAPMSDQNERTIGAVYGGVLMNHFYDIVDQSSHALGGKSALLDGDAIVASTITQPDGTRVVDQQVPKYNDTVKNNQSYTGTDDEGGTTYLARIDPIVNDQNEVIGARWYGVPLSNFTDIQNHTVLTLALWGLVALVIALALAIPIVERLSRSIAKRSAQVSSAAKELGVIIVGSEVSGDHVAQTKAAVERSGAVINELGAGDNIPAKKQQLADLNSELYNDIVVIDTLAQEMNGRMKQAVDRVAELNDVAGGLNKLVTGSTQG